VPTVHREPAPAKLTRSLSVVGVRADGYHLLDAEMVTLDLADQLEIWEAAEVELSVVDEVAWTGGDLSAVPPCAPAGGANLVVQALEKAGRRALVRLVKRIPAAAGLGGGSADAAAVLRWAGVTDPATAAELGADVPFCVVGGRARVSGVGEVVEPLPPVALHVVLVTPRLEVRTGLVYNAWDAAGGPRGEGRNDLESPAIEVEPRLRWWRDVLAGLAGRPPALAGSGSTWFYECADRGAAERLAAEVRGAVEEAGAMAMVVATGAAPDRRGVRTVPSGS
jgi:4-diphosphocytidyl-2-C-methyl-D-erythritol kinase